MKGGHSLHLGDVDIAEEPGGRNPPREGGSNVVVVPPPPQFSLVHPLFDT